TLDDTEWDLVAGKRRSDDGRESDLQNGVLLLPVDGGEELEPAAVRGEPDRLTERAAGTDDPVEGDLGGERSAPQDVERDGGPTGSGGFEMKRIALPGVLLHRAVVVQLEPVARGSKRLLAVRLLHQREHVSAGGEDGPQLTVLEHELFSLVDGDA